MTDQPPANALEILAAAMVARAERIAHDHPASGSVAVTREVSEMQRRQLLVDGVVQGAGAEDGPLVTMEELPEDTLSLAIGNHRVLIGSLGRSPKPHAVQTELRHYLNQMAIAWSWLGTAGDDLLLILVGPENRHEDGHEDKKWQQAVSVIERDERVCRKLVWLPPADAERRNESLETLLDRTFLARPWPPKPRDGDTVPASTGDINIMARLFARISDGALTGEEARRWIDILSDPAEPSNLAEALVAALESEQ